MTNTKIQIAFRDFNVTYFKPDNKEIVIFSLGNCEIGIPIVRIHSSCLFGEAFNSQDCDCAQQLNATIKRIVQNGAGIIVYVFEEGRGIGLENKIKAIEIERTEEVDTVEAFRKLGFEPDPRDLDIPAKILSDLNTSKTIGLFSGNPKKKQSLEKFGFKIVEEYETSEPLLSVVAKKEKETKRTKLGYSYKK
ncbi:MAG: GTP cyclohydrolase II [Patescibacteria group bacterium]